MQYNLFLSSHPYMIVKKCCTTYIYIYIYIERERERVSETCLSDYLLYNIIKECSLELSVCEYHCMYVWVSVCDDDEDADDLVWARGNTLHIFNSPHPNLPAQFIITNINSPGT